MRFNPPALRIIRGTPRHLRELVPLFLGYLKFYRQSVPATRARVYLRDRLSRSESVIFLARLDGVAVGFVQLYPTFASLALKRSWVLYDLFVLPDARQRGVAKALLERARRLARETGAEGLTLETAKDNRPAQQLYECLGWRRDEQFYRYHLAVRPGNSLGGLNKAD